MFITYESAQLINREQKATYTRNFYVIKLKSKLKPNDRNSIALVDSLFSFLESPIMCVSVRGARGGIKRPQVSLSNHVPSATQYTI